MSEAVSSVSNTQGTQQAQRVDQSTSTTQPNRLEAPNASAVQAFNSNASTDAASSANGTDDITANTSPPPPPKDNGFGNQSPVSVRDIDTPDGGRVIEVDNGHVTRELSVAEMEQKWAEFLKSDDAPSAASMDARPTPWGDNVSSTVYTAFLNYLVKTP